ncbi:MAG: hypothetical protein IKN74_01125 [Clostridia bacterium]|nr:hypothetical protein [Bacilli bacterium]MBR3511545.1 hypothetical protein [Clostridia bacterium]
MGNTFNIYTYIYIAKNEKIDGLLKEAEKNNDEDKIKLYKNKKADLVLMRNVLIGITVILFLYSVSFKMSYPNQVKPEDMTNSVTK